MNLLAITKSKSKSINRNTTASQRQEVRQTTNKTVVV